MILCVYIYGCMYAGHEHKIYSMSSIPLSHHKISAGSESSSSSSSSLQNGKLLCVAGEHGKLSFFPLFPNQSSVDKDAHQEASEGSENEKKLLYSVNEADGAVLPLISVKLHNRWVADVQFLNSDPSLDSNDNGREIQGEEGEMVIQHKLVSASDDASIVLSQFQAQSCYQDSGSLTPLARLDSLHSRGIFSMHVRDRRIGSGGKDGNVGISNITETSLVKERVYDEIFNKVIKSVRWSPLTDHLMAAGGNERVIALIDARAHRAKPVLEIDSGHSQTINMLEWSPVCSHTLVSTSMDGRIHVFDIRRAGSENDDPVLRLSGHHRGKPSMANPLLLRNNLLLTGGAGTSNIYGYSLLTGKQVKCIYVGISPSRLFWESSHVQKGSITSRAHGLGMYDLLAASGRELWGIPNMGSQITVEEAEA